MTRLMLLLFIAVAWCSCADPVEYPSTFELSSSTIQSYEAFEVIDGALTMVNPEDVPPPDLSLFGGAIIKSIDFVDGSMARVTDSFGTDEVEYTGRSSQVSFTKDGQRVELDGVVEADRFTYRSIHGGDFDGESINVYISALCGDIVDCINIEGEEWLLGSSAFNDGKIMYVIILENTLTKI